MTDPVDFKVKQLPYELSSQGGLALIGRLFKRINLPALVDPKYPVRSGIANSDILKCYLGLLTLGKNDFEAIEGFRSQRFAHQALGLRAVPSSATLRQRFDAFGCEWSDLAPMATPNCPTDGRSNGSRQGKFLLRAAPNAQARCSTRPGLSRLCGSSACLIWRIRASACASL